MCQEFSNSYFGGAMLMGAYHRHYRRSDLFLVRLWTEDGEDAPDPTSLRSDVQDSNIEVWRGKVQRVGDGEAYRFNGLEGLTEALLAMLSHASSGGDHNKHPASITDSNDLTDQSAR